MDIILTVILFLIEAVLTIATYPFDKKRKLIHAQCFWWSDIVIGMNPKWHLEVKGLENIDPNQAYVAVANHLSLADIIVMYQTRMQFKWVAKESLFKLPFVGWCLSLSKHIRITRGEFGSIKKVYRAAAEWLREDISVMFFPEGTRSETGEMLEFQNGPFKLAIKEKRPVLPIVITGTSEAIPKGGWVLTTNVSVTLAVLPPVDTSGYKPGDFAELRDLVKRKMTEEQGIDED